MTKRKILFFLCLLYLAWFWLFAIDMRGDLGISVIVIFMFCIGYCPFYLATTVFRKDFRSMIDERNRENNEIRLLKKYLDDISRRK